VSSPRAFWSNKSQYNPSFVTIYKLSNHEIFGHNFPCKQIPFSAASQKRSKPFFFLKLSSRTRPRTLIHISRFTQEQKKQSNTNSFSLSNLFRSKSTSHQERKKKQTKPSLFQKSSRTQPQP